MPRGKRICPGGTVFHVLNRGNQRQTLFQSPGDYEALVRVVVGRAEDWVWSSAWAYLHPNDRRALPLCDWPVPRPEDWLRRVNIPLTDAEINALRTCAERGAPYGQRAWVDQTAETLDLARTLRPPHRPPRSA
jgi:hypothetical protein